jgi:hypothetical protein
VEAIAISHQVDEFRIDRTNDQHRYVWMLRDRSEYQTTIMLQITTNGQFGVACKKLSHTRALVYYDQLLQVRLTNCTESSFVAS